jgi:hypothetical protein
MAYYGLEPTSDEFKNLKIGYKYRNLKNPFIPFNFQRIIIIITGMAFSVGYLIIVLQSFMTDRIEMDEIPLMIQLLSSNIFLIVLYIIIVMITLYYYKISEFFYEGKNKFEINFSLGFKFIVIGMILYFIVATAFSPTIIIHILGMELYSEIYEGIAYVRGVLNVIFNIIIIYGVILLARATRSYQWRNPVIKEKRVNTKLKTSTTFKFKNN